MEEYRLQFGCWNCKYVFVFEEYEQGDILYCTYGAPKRPLCGSVALGENPFDFGDPIEIHKRWQEWSEGREVEPYGICLNWTSKLKEIEDKLKEEAKILAMHILQSDLYPKNSDVKTSVDAILDLTKDVKIEREIE